MATQVTPSDFAVEVAKQFQDDGYDVIDPQHYRTKLPPGYVPDIILQRGDDVIIVEIKQLEEHRDLNDVREIKAAIERNPQWHFQLLVAPHHGRRSAHLDNSKDFEQRIELAEKLNSQGLIEEASAILWMVLEAAMRVLLTKRQSRPNLGVSGMSMARSLHGLGDVDEKELRLIDTASRARHLSVHGYRLTPRKPIDRRLFSLARKLTHDADMALT
jgi:hypothetical protein